MKIAAAVDKELGIFGSDGIIGDTAEEVFDIYGSIADLMQGEDRTELNERDYSCIRQRVRKLATKHLPKPKRRFAVLDRVVCKVGGDREWAAGTVQAIDQDDITGQSFDGLVPYVVKIDPPNSRLVSVPEDSTCVVRAEVCFGQQPGALWFTGMCLPKAVRRGAQRTRRFRAGERVACAVADATDDYADWAAGTVAAIDHPVEVADGVAGGLAPYEVLLDSGGRVVVHVDEHWLIRDLALQPVGPRIAPDGTRCVARMDKRRAGDAIEMVDHATRKVRRMAADDEDEDDNDESAALLPPPANGPPASPPAAPPVPPPQELSLEDIEWTW